jgi:pimeloyl-ACP methyl ester carboxylesterase
MIPSNYPIRIAALALWALPGLSLAGPPQGAQVQITEEGERTVACENLDGVSFGPVAAAAYHEQRGTIGGVPFQIALPAEWNGKLLVASHHFLASPVHPRAEDQSDLVLKVMGLCRGYAYAMSDEGWDHSPDQHTDYFNSKKTLPALARASRRLVSAEYGSGPGRTYIAGFSVGGHHAKWMAEQHPHLFDGALAIAGPNSAFNWARYEVTTLQAIAASLAAKGICTDPTGPGDGTCIGLDLGVDVTAAAAEVEALQVHLRRGLSYGLRPALSEAPLAYFFAAAFIVPLTIGTLDPNAAGADGVLSWDEILAWDFDQSVSGQQEAKLRRLDLAGTPRTKLITVHGAGDAVVPQRAGAAYIELADARGFGHNVRELLVPEVGHLAFFEIPGFFGADVGFQTTLDALDALDRWVEDDVEPELP